MPQYQRLLLIANREVRRTPALDRAAAIAQATGASLHIVAFVQQPARSFRFKIRRGLREQMHKDRLIKARQTLDVEVMRLRTQGLNVTSDVVDTRQLSDSIQAYILELKPDLAIKDAERGGHLRRIILRSLDWALLRECPTPFLLVRSAPSPLPRRVVVAVDLLQTHRGGGQINDGVIRYAVDYALQFDADVQLAYSMSLQNPRHVESALDTLHPVAEDDEMDDGIDRHLSERQARFRTEFEILARRHSVPEESAHLLFGLAEQTLPELARTAGFDTLVIGSAQHDVLEQLLGRTGENIVERMPCDVLVVRH